MPANCCGCGGGSDDGKAAKKAEKAAKKVEKATKKIAEKAEKAEADSKN